MLDVHKEIKIIFDSRTYLSRIIQRTTAHSHSLSRLSTLLANPHQWVPKGPQESPKRATGGHRRSPRGPPETPKTAHARQDGPRGPRDGPRGPQYGPKEPQKDPQEGPEMKYSLIFARLWATFQYVAPKSSHQQGFKPLASDLAHSQKEPALSVPMPSR